jgi:hypothetical protein
MNGDYNVTEITVTGVRPEQDDLVLPSLNRVPCCRVGPGKVKARFGATPQNQRNSPTLGFLTPDNRSGFSRFDAARPKDDE